MNPLIENLIVSLLTGLTASATVITQTAASGARDWIIITSTGAIAFSGAFINGLRQLHKEP